ncbi:hypothetical protein SAY87_014546 [Trapa incisa]|uniref:Pectin acetylesterase n=1 Tax=Trapa incisa TaxID=236973 RepID=A0AAN7GWZ8_9MYRT|nr:hypothetical protein SAY87_014546 [Trapa incisa]
MENARLAAQWLFIGTMMTLLLLGAEAIPGKAGKIVKLTYLEEAVAKGAVCLDGSPPAYHFSEGFDAGVNNWLVFFEGGAWCNNATNCLLRRDTALGSSKHMVKEKAFSGIFSNMQELNPDFYNWNRIRVKYCDGSSYTGDVEAVDPKTNLHYRGARIFQAIIDNFLSKGMNNAENAILAGCSAGGLATILHCDRFRQLVPAKTKVKCFADAGYFINAKTVSGTPYIEEFYSQLVETHESAKNLPTSCTSKMKPGLCFFPENVIPGLKTPIFILNAAYDSWQIKNILAPGIGDPKKVLSECKLNIEKCSPDQLKILHDYRNQFVDKVNVVSSSNSANGMFIDGCYSHCQAGTTATWIEKGSPVLKDTSIAKAFGDWYFERKPFKEIDCTYPCNPTCHNRAFDTS